MRIIKHEKRNAGKDFTCWLTGEPIPKGTPYWRTELFYQGRRIQIKTSDPRGEKLDKFLLQNRNHETWVKTFYKNFNTV